MKIRGISFSVVLLAIAGCGGDALSPNDSRFSATITGAETVEYEGDGYFVTQPRTAYFNIHSEGAESYEGVSISLAGSFSDIPAEGTYQIVPHQGAELPAGAFIAAYMLDLPNSSQADDGETIAKNYTARSGEIEITTASESMVAGRFEFSALRFCHIIASSEEPGTVTEGSCQPTIVEVDAPAITVSGTFSVGPDDRVWTAY